MIRSPPSRPIMRACRLQLPRQRRKDRKSTRLNSSHHDISYAVFCLKKIHAAAEEDALDRPEDVTRRTGQRRGRRYIQCTVVVNGRKHHEDVVKEAAEFFF